MTTAKIGLALGGGGARGLAHFGVMRYLEEHGIPVHCIAGTSMGAIVGAAIASGDWHNLAQGYARLDWIKLLPLFDITFSGAGLLDGRKALDFLKAHIHARRIEDLAIPYAAVAANLTRRRREVFTRGDLFHAMRASYAIPGIFTPVRSAEGDILVDGGIVEQVPVITAHEMGAEHVIAVEVNGMLKTPHSTLETQEDAPLLERLHEELHAISALRESEWGQQILSWFRQQLQDEEKERLPGLFEVMRDSIDFMQEEVMRMQLAGHPPRWLVTVDATAFSIWDYHRAEAIIETGYAAAQEQLRTLPDELPHLIA